MAEVTVAIPTYRRPRSLARLLEALERLQTSARVSVLVADNDASGREGFALCSALRERGYRWPLEAIIAPERGIAQVRNALTEQILAHSRPDFIAMLDDDEWPEPRWLDAFLEVQALTGADALHGAVVRDFEIPPARAAVACHGIAPLRHRSGPVPMIQSTSNVLVRRECFECLAAPCFDPAFALSGGEDRDFFERLRRQGRRFAWADEAVAHAWVPASRTGLGWVLKRAYRTGNSDMRVFLKHWHTRAQLAREFVKIIAAVLVFVPLSIVTTPLVRRRAPALCKLFRAAGKFTAIAGYRYDEYATVHGD